MPFLDIVRSVDRMLMLSLSRSQISPENYFTGIVVEITVAMRMYSGMPIVTL